MCAVKHFKFKVEDLDISIDEIEKYAHLGDGMPNFKEFLKNELVSLNEISVIEGGYNVQRASANHQCLNVNETQFNVGDKVCRFYKDMTEAAVFVCSAGKEITQRALALTQKGDLVEGYLLDVMGSVMVEKAMDRLQDILQIEMKKKGLQITNRYSPGYCDWDVKEQKLLFEFFPPEFCNVILTDSCLMRPAKTVSGIIGIGEKVKFHKHECHLCNSVNCIYRNTKTIN